MIEKLTADTQARLSYGIVAGYFALKILEGLKIIDTVRGPDELVMLVGAFWFMRSRPQEKPNA